MKTLDDALREFDKQLPIDLKVPEHLKTDDEKTVYVRNSVKAFIRSVWPAAEAKGRETPEKREKPKDRTGYHNSYAEGYDDGWNECIDSLVPYQKENT